MEERVRRPSFPSRRFAPGRPPAQGTVRPLYAAVFDLDPDGYDHARETVLAWLRSHRTVRGHEALLAGDDFDLNLWLKDGLVAQAVRPPDGNVTVVRLQHRETDRSGKLDRLRDWRIEVTVERDEGHAWIATRQWFAGLADDIRDSQPPRFVKDLWSEHALSDIEIFERTCRLADYDLDADDVVDLINDPDRDLPVIVIADGCPMDHERVAADFVGLAHVVKLSQEARHRFNSDLGDRFGLIHGSLQTFYARVADARLVAPASSFETIIGWQFADLEGPAAFSKWLRREVSNAVIARMVNDTAHRSYEEIRTKVIQMQRSTTHIQPAVIDNELLDLAESEIEDLRKQLAEVTERAQSYLNQKSAADEYANQEVERNRRLQADKVALQHALNEKTGAGPIVWDAARVERLIMEQPEPKNTHEAVENAQRLFILHNQKVRVSEEAEEGAMEALHFKRPADIQAAMIRLGFLWTAIRSSGQRLDIAAKEAIRFPCSMFESETTMRLYGHQRSVRIDGSLVTLPRHIKFGGGGTDDSARIHFGDKGGEVLIGHVGRHLTTAKTN